MGPFAILLLVLLLTGAAASWIVGAVAFARGWAKAGDGSWLRAVAWPFGMAKLRDRAPEQAAIVNKAIVAFFVCVTLAMTTVSVSTNYNRLSH